MNHGMYYDQSTGNRLSLMMLRSDGLGLFQDIDDNNCRVVCRMGAVGEYPPPKRRSRIAWPLRRVVDHIADAGKMMVAA